MTNLHQLTSASLAFPAKTVKKMSVDKEEKKGNRQRKHTFCKPCWSSRQPQQCLMTPKSKYKQCHRRCQTNRGKRAREGARGSNQSSLQKGKLKCEAIYGICHYCSFPVMSRTMYNQLKQQTLTKEKLTLCYATTTQSVSRT